MPESKFNQNLAPEILYRQLIEHMYEAVWMGDVDERTVYANPKFCELMEYSLEEMLGRESYDFWDEESAECVRNVNLTDRKQGVSSSYEGNLLTKSGKKIPVLLSGTPLPNGGTIGIMTDLTELTQRESLDMYQDLVERMNEAIILADGEENTVYANPKFCEILGISMEETLNKKTYDFFDQETAEKIRYENEHKRKQGLSSRYEGKLVNKKGEKIPVLVNGTPLPGGGSLRLLTDLTEVKKSEEKERALNSAVMYATDAIIIFNSEGEITSWNKGAKVIFGYKLEEINGKSIKTIFSEEDVDQLISEGKLLYNIELEGRHKNNKPVNISATLTPVKKGNKKKATSFLLIARDITNQAKFEEELTLKYEKMKEAYNQFGVLRRQMDYMFEVLNFFSEEHDTKTMADFFVSSIIMLTHVDACVLRLYNIKKDSLDLLSSFGVGENWKGKASIKYPKSLAEKAFDRGAALKIIDVVREPRYQSKYLAKKNNLCSLLLIPLKFQSKFVGSLSLYVNPDKRLEIFENEFIEKYAKLIEMAVGTMFKPTST